MFEFCPPMKSSEMLAHSLLKGTKHTYNNMNRFHQACAASWRQKRIRDSSVEFVEQTVTGTLPVCHRHTPLTPLKANHKHIKHCQLLFENTNNSILPQTNSRFAQRPQHVHQTLTHHNTNALHATHARNTLTHQQNTLCWPWRLSQHRR